MPPFRSKPIGQEGIKKSLAALHVDLVDMAVASQDPVHRSFHVLQIEEIEKGIKAPSEVGVGWGLGEGTYLPVGDAFPVPFMAFAAVFSFADADFFSPHLLGTRESPAVGVRPTGVHLKGVIERQQRVESAMRSSFPLLGLGLTWRGKANPT